MREILLKNGTNLTENFLPLRVCRVICILCTLEYTIFFPPKLFNNITFVTVSFSNWTSITQWKFSSGVKLKSSVLEFEQEVSAQGPNYIYMYDMWRHDKTIKIVDQSQSRKLLDFFLSHATKFLLCDWSKNFYRVVACHTDRNGTYMVIKLVYCSSLFNYRDTY